MSRVDPHERVSQGYPIEPDSTAIFPADRDGEDGMGLWSSTHQQTNKTKQKKTVPQRSVASDPLVAICLLTTVSQ